MTYRKIDTPLVQEICRNPPGDRIAVMVRRRSDEGRGFSVEAKGATPREIAAISDDPAVLKVVLLKERPCR